MWTIIFSFLKSLSKTQIIIIIMSIIISILTCTVIYQNHKIDSKDKEINHLQSVIEYEREIFESERLKAKKEIEFQNKAISDLQINEKEYKNKIRNKEKELSTIKAQKEEFINKSLQEDSSCDNQLRLINNMLKEFSKESNSE